MLVLAMAGTVGLQDFVWPPVGSLETRVDGELERLQQDPFLGGFVPTELAVADPAVKLFVVFLTHELVNISSREKLTYRWLRTMQLAAAGHADAQTELGSIQQMANKVTGIF